eukprot:CAMPEP_0174347248 /NCGR_PEP_ID=MMETSP0811_2-20130205/3217_1 /TAXON_ID=73025 ORGANISM="Eutreptiella gymnastica-like, Strain CCMP1594" /NCGR_SAMPLE_ID=MMETSP0811_2 /ASSEMBLY_ACC=CAM_ASM_000667 /LENGTH=104 /DNA_ID=CAMNT_0015472571 /DNA_START=556 /DNA_END=871 /DNA_ORIENTATION=+
MIGIHNSLQHVCPHVPAPSSIQPHVQGEGEREPLMPYTGGPPFCGHTQAVWRLLLARALVGGLFSVELHSEAVQPWCGAGKDAVTWGPGPVRGPVRIQSNINAP